MKANGMFTVEIDEKSAKTTKMVQSQPEQKSTNNN